MACVRRQPAADVERRKNVRWKTAIHGRGWSSPVVVDDQVWMTTATPDGKELSAWPSTQERQDRPRPEAFKVEKPQDVHPFNSYASPTPVVEEGRVYVTFGSPGTAASTRTPAKCSGSAATSSAIISAAPARRRSSCNLLILNFDGSDLQYVVALDKNTGKTVWKTPRSIDFKDLDPDGKPKGDGDFRKAFATPHIVDVGGQPLLISLALRPSTATTR